MERIGVRGFDFEVSEPIRFWIKSGLFLFSATVILFVALAASYPAVHDTLHNFRHALAIVPCH
ncbi:MAG TPA: CbtB-domain containing protein [Candidatus Binatia bacterium]